LPREEDEADVDRRGETERPIPAPHARHVGSLQSGEAPANPPVGTAAAAGA